MSSEDGESDIFYDAEGDAMTEYAPRSTGGSSRSVGSQNGYVARPTGGSGAGYVAQPTGGSIRTSQWDPSQIHPYSGPGSAVHLVSAAVNGVINGSYPEIMCPYCDDLAAALMTRIVTKGVSEKRFVLLEKCLMPFVDPGNASAIYEVCETAINSGGGVRTAKSALRNAYIASYIESRVSTKAARDSSVKALQRFNSSKAYLVNNRRALTRSRYGSLVDQMRQSLNGLRDLARRDAIRADHMRVRKLCSALMSSYLGIQKIANVGGCMPDINHPIDLAWNRILKKVGAAGLPLSKYSS
jgi:hypothetical protein